MRRELTDTQKRNLAVLQWKVTAHKAFLAGEPIPEPVPKVPGTPKPKAFPRSPANAGRELTGRERQLLALIDANRHIRPCNLSIEMQEQLLVEYLAGGTSFARLAKKHGLAQMTVYRAVRSAAARG